MGLSITDSADLLYTLKMAETKEDHSSGQHTFLSHSVLLYEAPKHVRGYLLSGQLRMSGKVESVLRFGDSGVEMDTAHTFVLYSEVSTEMDCTHRLRVQGQSTPW